MSRNLTNKIAVITGGAQGIGFEIADKFLRNDAKAVIILDINENQGTASAKQLNGKYGSTRAVFIKCDVTKDLETVGKEIFEKYEKVDVLVNNAGILNVGMVKKIIDVNVVAVIEWTTKFYEHMRKDKNGRGGTIINMSSIWGFSIIEYVPVYQASKFAVFGFTKCLGHVKNYDRTGVRVVGLCPGFTDTDLVKYAKPWDEVVTDEFQDFMKKQEYQNVDVVGEAAVDVFIKASSGTNWVIEGGKPIYEV